MIEHGRVVALDVGSRRIGVAACDPFGIVVRPVGVVHAEPLEQALAAIRRIVEEEEAQLLVVGLPITLRGEQGPQAQRVLTFAAELEKVLPVPLVFVDERYTSVEAERIIKEQGSKRNAGAMRAKGRASTRRQRERVDEIAAALILEDFLQDRHLRAQAHERAQREQEDDSWQDQDSDHLDHIDEEQ